MPTKMARILKRRYQCTKVVQLFVSIHKFKVKQLIINIKIYGMHIALVFI